MICVKASSNSFTAALAAKACSAAASHEASSLGMRLQIGGFRLTTSKFIDWAFGVSGLGLLTIALNLNITTWIATMEGQRVTT